MRYVDPDGRASILQRPINKGSKSAYNIANWFGTKLGWFLHGLVDYDDLTSTNNVSQYSGSASRITKWQINIAWKKHLKEISKRKGEWIEIKK